MIHDLIQLWILITSALAIYFVARTDKASRWGFIFGLLSEPGWIYAALTADQWGVTFICAFWTYYWGVGAWRRFRTKRGRGDWMLTSTGFQYWPADPQAADVCIFDIAKHLSMLCRYTGACRHFYSVAEHSVYVSRLVPEEHALTALLHDATEAYIADINRPTKQSLPDYKALEELNWKQAIAPAFGLPQEMPECIHIADRAVGRAEQNQIMPPLPGPDCYAGTPAADITIECLPPKQAERAFIDRYMELQRRRREAVDQGFDRPASQYGLVAAAVGVK